MAETIIDWPLHRLSEVALVELGVAVFQELGRRHTESEMPEDSPCTPSRRLTGRQKAAEKRWKAIARAIDANGPQTIAAIAEQLVMTYEGVLYAVRESVFAAWFELKGGKVSLTNQGRQEALPQKEEVA